MDSTTIGTNATNLTTSQLESNPIKKKMEDPTPMTQPKKSSKTKGESARIRGPGVRPIIADSSSSESDLSDDRKYRKSKSKGCDKNKSFGNA